VGVVVDEDVDRRRIADGEAQPDGIRERRSGDAEDAVVDLGVDRRGGLDGSGDGERQEPGGAAERKAWKERGAAVKGTLKQGVGMHWYVTSK
jgi:hypothetical protein